MTLDFDSLTQRVGDTAAGLKAYGYLNTIRAGIPGGPEGFEIRFQPNPIHRLWDDRRLGFSQRFASAADVRAFLDVVDSAAGAEAPGIEANDPVALGRVLDTGQEFRKHIKHDPMP